MEVTEKGRYPSNLNVYHWSMIDFDYVVFKYNAKKYTVY